MYREARPAGAGLTIALFLIVAGGTGALLAFYPELERITAPAFHQPQSIGVRLVSIGAQS